MTSAPPESPPSGPAPRSGRLAFTACGLLCLGLLAAAYSNFFENAFAFDDSHVLENNVYLRSLGNIPRFFADARTFSSLPQNATYRPLVSLSLALDYRLAGGLSPVAYHASQLVLLALFGVALFAFYLRLMNRCLPGPANRYLALFAAALFCLHTANTETMNLMHARSEIQSALGLIGGFLAYWAWPRARRWLFYLVPVALGALAKLPALMFGPLLFALVLLEPPGDPADRPTDWRRSIRPAALAAAPALLAAVVLYWFIEVAMRAPKVTYGGGDRVHYALTQLWAWVHYLRLFFLPVGLTADTDLKLIADWWDTRVVAGAVLVALLALAIWRCAGHRTRWPIAFGLAWFALGLAPTSSVLPLAEPVNEHRIFLPYVGLTLAVVWAARLWLGKRLARWTAGPGPRWAAPAAVCGLILAGHAAGAHARNATWRTSESLWADVTTKSPLNGRAWMNYGLALMRRGEYPGAKAAFERAQPLTPSYSFLEVNIGILNGAMGDQQAAEAHFRRALELEADQPGSHYFYARWLVQRGRSPEAIPHLQEVVRLSPADEPARRLLLDLSSARGDLDATSRQARDYLAIFPDDRRAQAYLAGRTPVAAPPATLESYLARGLALGKQEDFVESALAYREALRLGPGSSDVLNNLGWTLGKLGFFPEALPYLEAAAKLRPEAELFRNNLKWVQDQLR